MLASMFEFNAKANEHVRAAMVQAGEDAVRQPLDLWYGDMFSLAAHICSAEEIWITRLTTDTNPPRLRPASDFPTLDALLSAWRDLDGQWRAYVRTVTSEEITTPITWSNTSGVSATRDRWKPMLQVALHSTEHRAHITVALSRLGIEHGAQDYIYIVE